MASPRSYYIKCKCGEVLTVNQVFPNATIDSTYDNVTVSRRFVDVAIEVEPHACTMKPPAPSIDTLVKENREELEKLHKKFLKWDDMKKHWMCTCPLCRSLEVGGDCQKGY